MLKTTTKKKLKKNKNKANNQFCQAKGCRGRRQRLGSARPRRVAGAAAFLRKMERTAWLRTGPAAASAGGTSGRAGEISGAAAAASSLQREREKRGGAMGERGAAGGGGACRAAAGKRVAEGTPASPSCSRGSAARRKRRRRWRGWLREDEDGLWVGFWGCPGWGRCGDGSRGVQPCLEQRASPPRAGCTYLPAPTTCPRSLSPASWGSPTPPEPPLWGGMWRSPSLLPLPTG